MMHPPPSHHHHHHHPFNPLPHWHNYMASVPPQVWQNPAFHPPTMHPPWHAESLIRYWADVLVVHTDESTRKLLASSKSLESDPIVKGIINQNRRTMQDLERDAYTVARHIWTVYIERMPRMPNPDGLQFDQILQRLEHRDHAVYAEIVRAKQQYTEEVMPCLPTPTPEQIGGTKSCCSVFFCCYPGFDTINGFSYCRTHMGIALMNACRHECAYCMLVNLLVLRGTPNDARHLGSMERHIRLPVVGGDVEVSIQRWCDVDQWTKSTSDIHVEAYNSQTWQTELYYHTKPGAPAPVPSWSFIYMRDTDFQLIAWVKIERLTPTGWQPVTEWDEVVQMIGSASVFWIGRPADITTTRSQSVSDQSCVPVKRTSDGTVL